MNRAFLSRFCMNLGQQSCNRGFTMVELLMVIILIGILSVIIVPRVFTSLNTSKLTAVKAIVAGSRSGIATFVAKKVASTGTATYPTYAEIGTVLDSAFLANPFNNDNNIRDAIGTYNAIIPPIVTTNGEGLAYDSDVGKFWANTDNIDENKL